MAIVQSKTALSTLTRCENHRLKGLRDMDNEYNRRGGGGVYTSPSLFVKRGSNVHVK